jgi:hypothetical protein
MAMNKVTAALTILNSAKPYLPQNKDGWFCLGMFIIALIALLIVYKSI